jgi:hypothetical protein
MCSRVMEATEEEELAATISRSNTGVYNFISFK